MGVDCKLITNKKQISLDRVYCFSSFIETGKIYKKQDFIELNFKCIKDHTSFIEKENFFNDKNIENAIYAIEYNLKAIENASELNMIIDDYDDRYFDDKFILELQAQQDVAPKV